MNRTELAMQLVGYQVRTADGEGVVGRVEGVRPRGLRLHHIAGEGREHGYLPGQLVGRVDEATNTIFLVEGVDAARVAASPPPPDESPEGWHKSEEWWADLLGHYGLYEAEGRSSEPFLHPDQS